VDKLIDEGIHLVSACQLAGFRHVVGTLWEVSDRHCVDVATVLYETIRDEGMNDVALYRGLHRAVRALRDGRIETRRVRGESSTAERTAIHHNGAEAEKVDDHGIEATQKDSNRSTAVNEDSFRYMTKANDAPASVTQTDNWSTCEKEEIEVVNDRNKENAKAINWNSGRTVGRDEDDGTRLGRDVNLCDDETGQESPLYWAPYIHFGV
jgi:CHAT domain-containing protein